MMPRNLSVWSTYRSVFRYYPNMLTRSVEECDKGGKRCCSGALKTFSVASYEMAPLTPQAVIWESESVGVAP